jgi:hypothetical protein
MNLLPSELIVSQIIILESPAQDYSQNQSSWTTPRTHRKQQRKSALIFLENEHFYFEFEF